MLAEIAQVLNLEKNLYLSKGESKDQNGKARNYILANAVEACIGAVYLDQGWEVADEFIKKYVLTRLPEILKEKSYIDPKSSFQEKSQELYSVTPNYKVLDESGPDHNKFFRVGVYINKDKISEGEGNSKQEAQIDAARNALKEKKWLS